MIQTKTLDCPSCGAELLDPIYDLEMVDGGRRRLTCGECGRPFTVEASLVYDVTADGEPSASPLADAVLAAFHLTNGSALLAPQRTRFADELSQRGIRAVPGKRADELDQLGQQLPHHR